MKESRIRVGTASWSEPEFVRAGWYPKGLAAGSRLAFYAQHFDLVELNSSFYGIPAPAMYERWVEQTPERFMFNVKCHRLLSRHVTKQDALPPDLRRVAEITRGGNVVLTPSLEADLAGRFLEALGPLEDTGKLGALLLQMTPSFTPEGGDLTRLESLLQQLKGTDNVPRQVVLELRHRAWLDDDCRAATVEFLRNTGVTLASIDGPPPDGSQPTIMPLLDEVTDRSLAYLRLHGRDAEAYTRGTTVAERFDYDYSDEELDEVVGRANELGRQAESVHVIFNNNKGDYAPRAAARLLRRLEAAAP